MPHGHDLHVRQCLNEFCRVVALVRAQRDLSRLICNLFGIGNHHLGRFTLFVTIGGGDYRVGNQAVAVVAQGVAHEAQLTGRIALAV